MCFPNLMSELVTEEKRNAQLYKSILQYLNKMRYEKDCKYVWVLTLLLCINI